MDILAAKSYPREILEHMEMEAKKEDGYLKNITLRLTPLEYLTITRGLHVLAGAEVKECDRISAEALLARLDAGLAKERRGK